MNYWMKTAALLGAVWLAACDRDPIVDPTEPGENTQHEAYTHGAPAGAAMTRTIGAEGGTLATADGRVQLTIPAGAVAKATTFSIQPVENTLPGARGESFRLLPEGTEFAKPVTLRFSYANFSLDGTWPEALFLSYQDAEGRYWAVRDTQLDKASQTLTVKTTHFSDWQLCETYRVVADKTTLKPKETAVLKLQYLVNGGGDELLTPLTPIKHGWVNYTLGKEESVAWSLNGEGKLIPSGNLASYRAPDRVPAQNPVQVTLKLSNFIPKYIKDRWSTSTTQLLLTTTLNVVDKGYLTVTFKGKTVTYGNAGFSDSSLPVAIDAGPDEENYFWIHLNGRGKGSYEFGPWHGRKAGSSVVRYQLGDKEYASDKGWCQGKGNVELVNEGVVIIEEYVKGEYIKGSFKGYIGDMDNPDCSPGGSPVSGKFVIWAD